MFDKGRREFITLLGGAAATWPLAGRAQQSAMPVIGFLSSRSPHEAAYVVAAFHRGLTEGGYSEGQNVRIEYRWAEGQYDRLPALAVDLVRRRVAVIVSTGGIGAAIAAKQATSTIPIVFTAGDDPIKHGLVASLNRPGGNVTGIYNFISSIEAKRFGLLRETVPTPGSIAVLLNPNYMGFDAQLKDLQEAARAIGQLIGVFNASSEADIHAAFRAVARLPAAALLVGADPFFNGRREQLVTLAAHYSVPAMYELREYALAGGLLSYGTNLADSYRQVGNYTARILSGDKPADLPVVQSSKFELVINLKTAKALGLMIPAGVLAIADEVIE
jgi:putative tryptophan/tyrosine transport system substrate-binding protein